jgi:hypothetical protein
MTNAIIPPTGSFLTLTVFSRAVPYIWSPSFLWYYRKRDGSRVTKEDLDRATYVRLITREKHMNENEDRRIEVVKASFFNHDYI